MTDVLDYTTRKAQRLVNAGAVTIMDDVTTAVVTGDHDTYIVVAKPVGDGWAMTCSCPSRNPQCSHAMAVRRTIAPADLTPPDDPFDGIT